MAGYVVGRIRCRIVTATGKREQGTATTSKILEAAVECVQEVGWARFSSIEVARRAGVSRGALRHHYPATADLAAAAIEHLVEVHANEFRALLSALPTDASPTESALAAVDVMWSIYQGPTMATWRDLRVAARTDEALRGTVAILNPRLEALALQAWDEMFPAGRGLPEDVHTIGPRFLLTLLDGLAIECDASPTTAPEVSTQVLRAVKAIIRVMATLDQQAPAMAGARPKSTRASDPETGIGPSAR